jgi:hypothetical protein
MATKARRMRVRSRAAAIESAVRDLERLARELHRMLDRGGQPTDRCRLLVHRARDVADAYAIVSGTNRFPTSA